MPRRRPLRKLMLARADRRLAMQEVRAVAELRLSEDEAKEELRGRLISKFDPMSILFSILVSWAVQQLVKWLAGKLKDRLYGDDE
jgi:hypothetical protein